MKPISLDRIKSSNDLLLSLLILSLSISLISGLGFIKYFGYAILFFWLLISFRSVPEIIKSSKFLQLFLIYSLWCVISFLWSISPSISFLRSGFQLFLILSVYLIIQRVHLNFNHFSYSIYLVTFLTGASLIFGLPADSWSGGNAKGFMGAFHHQNSLGAIILFLLPILNFSLFENYKKLSAAKLASLIAISLFLLITLFLTASRAAILSYLIFLFVFYSFINLKKTILALVSLAIIVSISLQFAPTSDYLHNLIYKGRDQFGASRFLVYKTSLQAASNGGLIGLGFNMSDPDNIRKEIGTTKNGFYQREKGSTALALIEETGVIGFILYFIAIAYLLIEILIQIFKYKYIYRDIKHRYKNIHEYRTNIKSNFSIPHIFLSLIANLPKSLYKLTISENRQSPHNRPTTKIFSFAFLTALIIHQQFEAYGVAVGSQFYLFFLLLLFSADKLKNTA